MVSISKWCVGFQFVYIMFPSLVMGTVARYDHYRLYELIPSTNEHLKFLKDIELNSDSYTFILGATTVNASSVVVVAPHKFAEFDSVLNIEKINNRIVADNVQTLIDEELFIQLKISEENFGWKTYYPLETIYTWIDLILEQYPNVTYPIFAGKTYENREIRGVKISYKNGNPGIFIEGGMHAREWISPAVATYLLNSLLTSKNESIRNIAENFDWYIFPSVNPDGYVYSHTTNRFWRKNRKPYGGTCVGVDPNRNWDFHFGEFSVSKNPCSAVYPGPKPFSEIEIKSYAEYLSSLKHKIHTFIAFHSYSQLLLFPYGHTAEKVANFDDLMAIGETAINGLARRYNTKYKVGNVHNTIYPASGSSMDWIYGVLSVPLSYTYELRPASSYSGFELPANEIVPTALETIDSIVAMLDHAKALGYYKLN